MPDSDSKIIDAAKLQGFVKLRRVIPMLSSLRDCGVARDRAHNRELFFDDYVALVLFYLFNPMLHSMRALQRASELDIVTERLGIKRFSLGSFSESVSQFDPQKLAEVVEQIRPHLHPVGRDARIDEHLDKVLTLVDGSIFKTLTDIAEASWCGFVDGGKQSAWKLHAHFDVNTFNLSDATITSAAATGESEEKNVLRRRLKSDHCYVMDRGYASFKLFNDIRRAKSGYVCRVKENSVFDVVEERLLSQEALDAGVVRDAVTRMGLNSKESDRPDHAIRIVVVECEPHKKRGGRRGKTAGPPSNGTIVIATDLLDVPAEVIALIYRQRWTIELFFRFLKQLLGCRHLISHKPEGVAILILCAVIACMLMNLWTGLKPDIGMLEVLKLVLPRPGHREERSTSHRSSAEEAVEKIHLSNHAGTASRFVGVDAAREY